MGNTITLTAIDGFVSKAYRADPVGDVRGGIVVIQEIFGVNGHIRSVADGYAAQGYSVIAPQLYDRSAPDIELGYQKGWLSASWDIVTAVPWHGAVPPSWRGCPPPLDIMAAPPPSKMKPPNALSFCITVRRTP